MTPDSSICVGRSHIFGSVFAPAPPGDFIPGLAPRTRSSQREGSIPENGKWDRAWRTATSFLSTPDGEFEQLVLHNEGSEGEFLKQWNRHKKPSKEIRDALSYLIKLSAVDADRDDGEPKSIIDWYGSEIRRHFLRNFKDELSVVSSFSTHIVLLGHALLRRCRLSRLLQIEMIYLKYSL